MYLLRNFVARDFLVIATYILIGVAVNTAAPHLPGGPDHYGSAAVMAHSWVQYGISVLSWPLSFWHPNFTTGKWTGG